VTVTLTRQNLEAAVYCSKSDYYLFYRYCCVQNAAPNCLWGGGRSPLSPPRGFATATLCLLGVSNQISLILYSFKSYKILNGVVAIDCSYFFSFNNVRASGHFKLYLPDFRLDALEAFAFHGTIYHMILSTLLA